MIDSPIDVTGRPIRAWRPDSRLNGRVKLFEYPGARGIAIRGALRLQAPGRGREPVGILELAREVRAVREARLVGDVGDRAVGVLDEPVRVAHAQLSVQRGGSH